jgi:hypothetical protein
MQNSPTAAPQPAAQEMTVEVTAERVSTRDNGQLLRLPQVFAFNPVMHPIVTKLPARRSVYSAWVGHVPFALALVDMAKPRVLVELGTHWGMSYCAFCQAVKELRLGTECFAVDTWAGDPHAGFYTNEVLGDLKAHHDERYKLFSTLLQSTFDDALPRFEDRSVDVLHIDGFHTYDAVRHDFESWLPKLSDRAVVLFHDTEVRDRESFGVWRFWDEIKQRYPHFEFHHSYGLGVLAVGDQVPDGLRPLIDLPPADADRVRQFFANLGNQLGERLDVGLQMENVQELLRVKADEAARASQAAAESAQQLAATQAHVAHLDHVIHTLNAELAATRRHYSQLRFRAVDKAAHAVNRVPFVYAPLRLTAKAGRKVFRAVKQAFRPAAA